MAKDQPFELQLDTVVHRIGGGHVANLQLKPTETKLKPPGFSVLVGGTPEEAAEQMRRVLADSELAVNLLEATNLVASAAVADIRAAGFGVFPCATKRFPNHARIVHSDGADGFTDQNLTKLAQVFQNTNTPRS